MIYDCAIAKGEMPSLASPVGRMCYFLLKMQNDREFFAHRALVQAVTNSAKIEDAFKASRDAFYPYMEEVTENKDKKAKDRLFSAMKEGPVQVMTLPIPAKAAKMFRRKK
jgi:hypothetical protein